MFVRRRFNVSAPHHIRAAITIQGSQVRSPASQKGYSELTHVSPMLKRRHALEYSKNLPGVSLFDEPVCREENFLCLMLLRNDMKRLPWLLRIIIAYVLLCSAYQIRKKSNGFVNLSAIAEDKILNKQ